MSSSDRSRILMSQSPRASHKRWVEDTWCSLSNIVHSKISECFLEVQWCDSMLCRCRRMVSDDDFELSSAGHTRNSTKLLADHTLQGESRNEHTHDTYVCRVCAKQAICCLPSRDLQFRPSPRPAYNLGRQRTLSICCTLCDVSNHETKAKHIYFSFQARLR